MGDSMDGEDQEELMVVWLVWNDGTRGRVINGAPPMWLGHWFIDVNGYKDSKFISLHSHPHKETIIALGNLVGIDEEDSEDKDCSNDFEIVKSWWIGREVIYPDDWEWDGYE